MYEIKFRQMCLVIIVYNLAKSFYGNDYWNLWENNFKGYEVSTEAMNSLFILIFYFISLEIISMNNI